METSLFCFVCKTKRGILYLVTRNMKAMSQSCNEAAIFIPPHTDNSPRIMLDVV